MDRIWIIYMGIIILAIVGNGIYADYNKHQCRTTAIQAGKTAAEIDQICK